MARLAIFDLDRTLTDRGGFMAGALFILRRRPLRAVALPQLAGMGLLLALKLIHRDRVKAQIWRQMLDGLNRAAAAAIARDFAERWAATALRPGARPAIARHKAAGDRLALATAAMDLVAEPFGQALGFDDIVATRTNWTADGRVGPGFDGLNCYGDEKLRRVKAMAGPDFDPADAVAYSDHITDLPLLAWAGEGVAVNPHPPLRAIAAAHGLRVTDWDIAPAPDAG